MGLNVDANQGQVPYLVHPPGLLPISLHEGIFFNRTTGYSISRCIKCNFRYCCWYRVSACWHSGRPPPSRWDCFRKERKMPVNPGKNRSDFKLEIRNGKLTLQTRFKPVWKRWMLTITIVIITLIILSILKPEGWLDILRAVLLILEPFTVGRFNKRLAAH